MNREYYVEKRETREKMPLQFSVHIQKSSAAITMAGAHIHDFIEIIYALSGEYQILLNTKEYFFGEGDMVLINSNEIHNIVSLHKGNNQYAVVKFEPELIYTASQSLFEVKYILPFIMKESTHQKIFKKGDIKNTIIPDIMSNILREYDDKKYGYELAIRANIFNLFLFILRSWNARNVDLNISQDINKSIVLRLQKVLDYIENNCQNDITALEMSNLCNLSYSYFSKIFSKTMRKNFREYLNYVRISKAEKLLATSDFNITDIAMEAGFSTSSYFVQQFKRYKGISPKQFQIKYLKAEADNS
ncbi:MAG: AraC family transcriptional regulator [Eubacteriales bacterium]|nr:AraC family transcriptional regulator [Eubacteriales bacterium]